MGWKEGEGLGLSVKKKSKKKKKLTENNGVKVYGCSLLPGSVNKNENEESDIDLENVTFAPKDVNPIQLTSKDNVHGLGCSGINPRFPFPGRTSQGRVKKTGAAPPPVSYVGKLLKGFMLSAKPLARTKVFPPLVLPASFRPIHRFAKSQQQLAREAIVGAAPGKENVGADNLSRIVEEA